MIKCIRFCFHDIQKSKTKPLEISDNAIVKGSIFDFDKHGPKIKNYVLKVITITVRMTTMVILMTMIIYIHTNSQFPKPLT